MHRHEAANIFALWGDADQLKITKMTYNHGAMDFTTIASRFELTREEINAKLDNLVRAGVLVASEKGYEANKELVDEVLNFMHQHCSNCGCEH